MFIVPSLWRRRTAFLARTRRPPPDMCRGFRPLLEALEARLTPSTLPVTSTADDVNQPGTLRYDVAHAQSGDTILLTGAVKGGIVLTQGELLLSQSVAITSAGSNQIPISGGGLSRVFEVAAGAQVSLSDLALTGGDGVASPTGSDPNDGIGGAILVDSGTLTVNNSKLFGNSSAFFGGAIENFSGTVNANDSLLSGNSAAVGGAIFNLFGTATVSDCTLSDNFAGGAAGAIANEGTMAVSNSTLSGNSVRFRAGGAIVNDGEMTVSDCTLSDNSVGGLGGAIANEATMAVSDCTLSGNSAGGDGGAIFNNGGTASVGTSTFHRNAPDNIVGGFNDLGGNSGLP